jgi:hypothetical protein
MKLFSVSHDGGKKSGVTGFWLVEIKSLFSIVILKFNKGSREAYHSHAFNAVTWWLKGRVTEHHLDGRVIKWKPSIIPKFTSRECTHKVYANETSYAISFRGPWSKQWSEYTDKQHTVLSSGREVVSISPIR